MMYGFKTAYEMFEHALLENTSRRNRKKSIYVKCPRCGRRVGCNFGPTSEGFDYLEEIYCKYRKEPDTGSGFERS